MIASGGGDDSVRFLLGGKECQGIGGAALFETSGALEVFEFAINPGAGGFG